MEIFFLVLLVILMAAALGSGFPVAFALPGAAILSIGAAAGAGYLFAGHPDAYFAVGGPSQWLTAGVTNLRGVYWEVERDTLIAIPLFIFMGIMLQRSKIAEDLLVTMAQLFGPIPGGLGISVVFVGALLAATTGIVGATVVAMGLISLPAMLRNNYSKPLATGTIAASGTLGQIIPPSIVLIILADQLASAADQASSARKALHKASTGELSMPSVFDVTSTSAGEMFLGAFVPGLVLVGLYMLFILVFAMLRPDQAPAVPYEGKYDRRFWLNVSLTLVPPLALIFLVLGSIISGIATVNQAGAIGAAGAMIMAGYRLREDAPRAYHPAILAIISLFAIGYALANYDMNLKNIDSSEDVTGLTIGLIGTLGLVAALMWSGWRTIKIDDTLQGVMIETAKTTSLVFIILLGAAMLTAAFRAFGGEELVREFLLSLPGGFWSQFIIVMAVIFVLGFFLDFIEIAVVVVPIVAPILLADPSANITAVWLGVMIGLNIQTSFLTPPFGFALFYLRGVAPASVRTLQIYKGVIAFICLQLLALVIAGSYPQLVNYLPSRVSLTAETAPPPRNPNLQYCLERYVGEEIAENEAAIRAAIAAGRAIDLSALPERMAGDVAKAFDSADEALAALDEALAAEREVMAAAETYRPLQREVRWVEKGIQKHEDEIKELGTRISRLRGEDQAELRARLEASKARLEEELEGLKATIPANWKDDYAAFQKLLKAEDRARLTYRRSADGSFEPVGAVLAMLDATEALKALGGDMAALRGRIETGDPAEVEAEIVALYDSLATVAGADDIRSTLSKARRAMRPGSEDRAAALAELEGAETAYAAEVAWREAAGPAVGPGLRAYADGVKETLGARVQPRLSEDQALYIAGCNAAHRDISLNF